ncbi:hypothetical protein MMC09_004907 [Bachmanniomyces sp. S44760]|nr:hypothetical protein [Bachmanniomyces sp. S44760]
MGSANRASLSPNSNFESVALVSFLSPTAHQSQLLSMLLGSMSQSAEPQFSPGFMIHGVWLGEVATRAGTSAVLDWAVRALSLSYVGHQVQDTALIQTSRQIYGKALVKLNAALQNSESGFASETLSATMLLSFFELLTCTERGAWIRHAGGAGRLLQLRGPERHRTGFDRVLFLACRHPIAMECFHKEQPCFLDSEPWRELCEVNKNSPSFPTPLSEVREEMFLEMIRLPGYIHNVVQAANNNLSPLRFRELLTIGLEHRASLKAIQLNTMNAFEATKNVPRQRPSPSDDEVFPVVYEYTSLFIGACCFGYWSTMSVVNGCLLVLQRKLEEGSPMQPNLTTDDLIDRTIPITGMSFYPQSPPPPFHTSRNDDRDIYIAEKILAARETCKSAEMTETGAFLGNMYLMFALREALKTLNGEPREREWILRKLKKIGFNLEVAKQIDFAFRDGRSET